MSVIHIYDCESAWLDIFGYFLLERDPVRNAFREDYQMSKTVRTSVLLDEADIPDHCSS